MRKEYKNRILACVDRGLDHLGESVKYTIYWYLEHIFGLKRDKIPDRPDEFLRGLEEMYGFGARIIEKIIVREMVREFGIEGRLDDFVEAIRTGRPPESDGAQGMRAVAVIHAIMESALARRPVTLDEVLDGSLHAYQDKVEAAQMT